MDKQQIHVYVDRAMWQKVKALPGAASQHANLAIQQYLDEKNSMMAINNIIERLEKIEDVIREEGINKILRGEVCG